MKQATNDGDNQGKSYELCIESTDIEDKDASYSRSVVVNDKQNDSTVGKHAIIHVEKIRKVCL